MTASQSPTMLRELAPDLLVAEQPLTYWGVNVGTRMTIVRLTSENLVVISPIQPNALMLKAINDLGQVRYIIAPNLYHHLFVSDFQAKFPQAQLWAVPGLEDKRPDLAFDAYLETAGQIEEQISYLPFQGFCILDLNGPKLLNEIVFYHEPTKTLILTDTAFHFDTTFGWQTQLAARIMGVHNKLQPSWLEKIALQNRQAAQQSIERILDWNFHRVIMAHGTIVETEAKQQLQAGYQWFLSSGK